MEMLQSAGAETPANRCVPQDPLQNATGSDRAAGLTVRRRDHRKERQLIVERTENPQWLSNAYLVADEAGGKGILIDGNDRLGPLLERAESDGIEITHILVTHPHADHIAGLAEARERLGGPPLVAHPEAAAEMEDVAQTLGDGEKLSTGGLELEAISTPGHAAGHVALLANGTDVFTADVLFKGTVGGTMAPGASGLDDLRASVMRLMELPPQTRVHPGHREPTTIGEEWEGNPFVRVWRGLEQTGEEACTVWGREATLRLWAPDYDGGNKAWVAFADSGEEAIVGGSQVERA
jgi:glyoxylase-like metal-dependent hydrolase (beta-lactamase superfamily II)